MKLFSLASKFRACKFEFAALEPKFQSLEQDCIDHAGEGALARGRYTRNGGDLTLTLDDDLEVPFGTTEVLVVYRTGAVNP